MHMLADLLNELFSLAMRALTGKFLSEAQINKISSSIVGKYYADWLPLQKDQSDLHEKVESANSYIKKATAIIQQIQTESENKSRLLDQVIKDVEEKKTLAERYGTLASTNMETFQAFQDEMKETVRKELINQVNQGKRTRQIISLLVWLLTLLTGAALGAYFKDIVALF